MHGIALATFLKQKLNEKKNGNSNAVTLVNNNPNLDSHNDKNGLNNNNASANN